MKKSNIWDHIPSNGNDKEHRNLIQIGFMEPRDGDSSSERGSRLEESNRTSGTKTAGHESGADVPSAPVPQINSSLEGYIESSSSPQAAAETRHSQNQNKETEKSNSPEEKSGGCRTGITDSDARCLRQIEFIKTSTEENLEKIKSELHLFRGRPPTNEEEETATKQCDDLEAARRHQLDSMEQEGIPNIYASLMMFDEPSVNDILEAAPSRPGSQYSSKDVTAFLQSVFSFITTGWCDSCIINALKKEFWENDLMEFFTSTINRKRSNRALTRYWKTLVKKMCESDAIPSTSDDMSAALAKMDTQLIVKIAKKQNQSKCKLSCCTEKCINVLKAEDYAAFLRGISECISVHGEDYLLKLLDLTPWNEELKGIMDKHFKEAKRETRSGALLKMQWNSLVATVYENKKIRLESFPVGLDDLQLNSITKLIRFYVHRLQQEAYGTSEKAEDTFNVNHCIIEPFPKFIWTFNSNIVLKIELYEVYPQKNQMPYLNRNKEPFAEANVVSPRHFWNVLKFYEAKEEIQKTIVASVNVEFVRNLSWYNNEVFYRAFEGVITTKIKILSRPLFFGIIPERLYIVVPPKTTKELGLMYPIFRKAVEAYDNLFKLPPIPSYWMNGQKVRNCFENLFLPEIGSSVEVNERSILDNVSPFIEFYDILRAFLSEYSPLSAVLEKQTMPKDGINKFFDNVFIAKVHNVLYPN